jgi:hypothetical protein
MLTTEELVTLEQILARARTDHGRKNVHQAPTIAPGDVVQLRPGADRTWESSLLLVADTQGGRLRGAILRPHRGGCREAWYTFTSPEVLRVGNAPYPAPPPEICGWSYTPLCAMFQRKPPAIAGRPAATLRQAQAIELDHQAARRTQEIAERLMLYKQEQREKQEKRKCARC